MRTNGLVWAVALSLFLAGRYAVAEPTAVADAADTGAPCSAGLENQACCAGDVSYCCAPAQDPFWYAGAELTFLHADYHSGTLLTSSLDNTATAGTEVSFATTDELQDWGYSPRTWLGVHLNENWSIEGRFWRLQDSEFTTKPGTTLTPPLFVNRYFTDTSIETYTVDLDLIRTFRCDGWQIDAQLGARHGSFTSETAVGGQTSDTFFTNTIEGDLGAKFNGTGFSYGGALKHSIGNSNLFWVTTARGSYLAGTEHARVTANSALFPSGGQSLSGAVDADATLVIAEFQTGIEWDYALAMIPANAFVRVSYEYQNWYVSGPIARSGGGGGGGGFNSDLVGQAGLGKLVLNGVGLSTGITW